MRKAFSEIETRKILSKKSQKIGLRLKASGFSKVASAHPDFKEKIVGSVPVAKAETKEERRGYCCF